ncbi:LemA family protein [Aquimarina hainanensis]|uniref:LemA family protein n=1 Tax=Aquimarina hainanensis TaxID=1578017 RepID=A0ABW5N654_9FLAO
MEKTIGVLIILVVGLFIIVGLIRLYNRLVMLKFNVDKSFANIDVLLQQRADEIPNLITTVKEYMGYERSILTELTTLRTQFVAAEAQNERVKLSNTMSPFIGKILAIAENYPELKSGANFLNLQNRISELEDAISDRREFFNESVNMYNIGINEFPNVLLGKLLGYQEKSLLTISEEEKEYHGVVF